MGKRKIELCDICRKVTRAGHRYCGDHRDPRPLPVGDEMLRWIEAQECPICRNGRTFTVLANHTVKAHGITGADIREAAHLSITARICSPEFTESHRRFGRPENLRPDANSGGNSREATALRTGARMRAYKRLAEAHWEEFGRLVAEESAH